MDKAEFLNIKKLINLVNENRLDLPNVQRGFVWKPSQIEILWDSLLRKYPSGAIITRSNGDNAFQLLDGQQRITSIALGFANIEGAIKDADVLRSSTKNVRIFIDMRKPDPDTEGKAYAFRVITRSHPWGYQRTDNTKPIETANKLKALKLWKKSDPFADDVLESAYPWDAVGPLPLNIFTQAALKGYGLGQLRRDLLHWVESVSTLTSEANIGTWLENHKSSISNKAVRRHEIYTIEEIYKKINEMVDEYSIPMQPLPEGMLDDDGPVSNSDYDSIKSNTDGNSDKEESDEIEEVFVRLNSAGTPLGGEELNYSIIKAKVGQDFQKRIEAACEGIMKPARFITIAFRLYQKSINEDSINLRIKPKQFQREMRNHKNFVDFIDKKILISGLLVNVRSILKFGEAMNGYKESIADYRLPYPLLIKVAAASQGEIMFMLMYRLLFGGNKKPDVFNYGSDEHRKMIGIILIFMWHGKDVRSRHNKLLEQVWKSVKTFQIEEMWSNKLISVAMGKEDDHDSLPKFELKPMPKKPRFFGVISKVQKNSNIWGEKFQNMGYIEFFENVMCNRDLLLWIQRRFLSDPRFFRDDLFRLDDTDVPFDWDHISPENLVKNKRNIPSPLKDIYNQPCNFRAWPFQLNRSDKDDLPAMKLSVNDTNRKFLNSALPDRIEKSIKSYLLENSFCEQKWGKFNEDWIDQSKKIGDGHWKYVYELIYGRWVKMSIELFKELRIKELA